MKPVRIFFSFAMPLFFLADSPNGCEPPPNTYETLVQNDRFADFNDTVTVIYGHSGNNYGIKWRDNKITLEFEPTRVGAYLIQGNFTNQVFTVISTADADSITANQKQTFEFDPSTTVIPVIFSDGKTMEVTNIKLP